MGFRRVEVVELLRRRRTMVVNTVLLTVLEKAVERPGELLALDESETVRQARSSASRASKMFSQVLLSFKYKGSREATCNYVHLPDDHTGGAAPLGKPCDRFDCSLAKTLSDWTLCCSR